MVRWHEELRIAEAFQRAHAEYDPLSSALGGFDLYVELMRVEYSRRRFEAIPVGAEANDLKRVGEQCAEGGRSIQAEGVDLWRAKADAERRRPSRCDRDGAPRLGKWLRGSRELRVERER